MYKPWTLMISSPYIYDVFKDCKCPGAEHKGKHEPTEGVDTWKSAFYPEDICDRVHFAIAERLDPVFRKDWISKHYKRMANEKAILADFSADDLTKSGALTAEDASGVDADVTSNTAAPSPVVYANAPMEGKTPLLQESTVWKRDELGLLQHTSFVLGSWDIPSPHSLASAEDSPPLLPTGRPSMNIEICQSHMSKIRSAPMHLSFQCLLVHKSRPNLSVYPLQQNGWWTLGAART